MYVWVDVCLSCFFVVMFTFDQVYYFFEYEDNG